MKTNKLKRSLLLLFFCLNILSFFQLRADNDRAQTSEQSFSSFVMSFLSKRLQKITNTLQETKKLFSNVLDKFANLSGEEGFWQQILLAFFAGLSVSLTPCIYPLIPVTVGILTVRRKISFFQLLARTAGYLLGLLTVFVGLGMLVTKFNLIFGSWLASPWVNGVLAIFFVLLALNLFDLIDIDFNFYITAPSVNSAFSAFLFGAVAALVSSPCMTPALLFLLSYIAKINNIFLSTLLLFSFGLGMTLLVIILSFFSSMLMFLPKPGSWMLDFKKVLGVGILFFSVRFVEPFFSRAAVNLLYGIIWSLIAIYCFYSSQKDSLPKSKNEDLNWHQNSSLAKLTQIIFLGYDFLKTICWIVSSLIAILSFSLFFELLFNA